MRFTEFSNKAVKECTTSGGIATSMGGGDGFGPSIFMKQATKESAPKRKTKTKMRTR